MESLKEIKKTCTLIAVFNNPTFVGETSNEIIKLKNKTKCELYGNGNGKYYMYKYIRKPEIREYENYEIAAERFISFVNIVLSYEK